MTSAPSSRTLRAAERAAAGLGVLGGVLALWPATAGQAGVRWALAVAGACLALSPLCSRWPRLRGAWLPGGLGVVLLGIAELLVGDGPPNAGAVPDGMIRVLWRGLLVAPLLGLGLAWLRFDPRGWHPSPLAATAATLLAAVQLLATAYAARGGAAAPWAQPLPGLLLGLGLLSARADRGPLRILLSPGPDGGLARRLLPVALAVPPLAGLLLVQGRGVGLFGLEMGTALLVTALASVAAAVVLWRAVLVDRAFAERRRSEAALRASEARHRAILDGALDAVVGMDARGRVSYWNPRAEAIFGWPREQALGRAVAELIVPERHRAAHREGLARVLATGEPRVLGRRLEIEALRRDGSEFPVELTVTSIGSPGGQPEFNAFVSDLTERRRLEEQYRQAQKMEAVGQLAGGIAHDFNNLLNVILGYTDLLRRGPLPAADLEARLLRIRRAAERAAALTRQLLAFSRKQVLQPRVLDVNAVVTEVEELLRRLIGENIELSLSLGARSALAKVDKGQLEQVIINLAVNARDAMPEGGRLLLETSSAELDAAYVQLNPGATAGRYVTLAVSDTGHGMDARTREHIFEPFFTTKEAGKGTGLGLATVYGIVKQSGGHIAVYSELGRGTTFRVYLPESAEAVPREEPAAPPQSLTRGSGTVLVAEDEPALRELVQEVLEERGYTVLACRNGDEALATAASFEGTIDLVVSDVVMPGISGPDLVRRLTLLRPGLRGLLLSGYPRRAIDRDGELLEGVPFLSKPIGADELARAVRDALERPGPARPVR